MSYRGFDREGGRRSGGGRSREGGGKGQHPIIGYERDVVEFLRREGWGAVETEVEIEMDTKNKMSREEKREKRRERE